MLLNNLRHLHPSIKKCVGQATNKFLSWKTVQMQTAKPLEISNETVHQPQSKKGSSIEKVTPETIRNVSHVPRIVPMVLNVKEPIVLPFDEVPGPKSLKYLSIFRKYITEFGTQLTASFLTFGLTFSNIFNILFILMRL